MKLLYLLSILAASRGEEDSSCPALPPFDAKPRPTIHVVMSITTGNYFVELLAGARLQAQRIGDFGVDMKVVSSEGDDVKQSELVLEAAQDNITVGILTVDGSAEAMCGAIDTV
jgi:ABC-type sugar transport system substrate-binding protein